MLPCNLENCVLAVTVLNTETLSFEAGNGFYLQKIVIFPPFSSLFLLPAQAACLIPSLTTGDISDGLP